MNPCWSSTVPAIIAAPSLMAGLFAILERMGTCEAGAAACPIRSGPISDTVWLIVQRLMVYQFAGLALR